MVELLQQAYVDPICKGCLEIGQALANIRIYGEGFHFSYQASGTSDTYKKRFTFHHWDPPRLTDCSLCTRIWDILSVNRYSGEDPRPTSCYLEIPAVLLWWKALRGKDFEDCIPVKGTIYQVEDDGSKIARGHVIFFQLPRPEIPPRCSCSPRCFSAQHRRDHNYDYLGLDVSRYPGFIGRDRVSIRLVQEWLKGCVEYHKDTCGTLRNSTRQTPGRSIAHLILIDVHQECLVLIHAPKTYIALSYVWGKAKPFQARKANFATLQWPGSLGSNNTKVPNIIRDSMWFTRAFGFQYLWVDCLCIVQDDYEQKQEYIGLMDVIYRQSYVTLVAVSGKSANSRLPGASPGSRNALKPPFYMDMRHTHAPQQGAANVADPDRPWKGCDTVEVMVSPCNVLDILTSSTYESRAWTFQERLLSRRCIYFTDFQVWFRCSATVKAEYPAIGLERIDGDLSCPILRLADALGGVDEGRGRYLNTYVELVEAYTRKDLSYPTDIVNAFSGLLRIFEEFVPCFTKSSAFGMPLPGLDFALLWHSKRKDARRRRPEEDRRENPRFPSWAWTGWLGGVEWHRVLTYDNTNGDSFTENPKPSIPLPVPVIGVISLRVDDRRFILSLSSDFRSRRALEHGLKDIGISRDMPLYRTVSEEATSHSVRTPTLIFQAEVVKFSQFNTLWLDSNYATLILQTKSGMECGILYHAGRGVLSSSDHEPKLDLIRISDMEHDHDFEWAIDSDRKRWPIHNIMLVCRKVSSYQRVAIGHIHPSAWSSADPTIKEVILK